jgi:hypothetical protein
MKTTLAGPSPVHSQRSSIKCLAHSSAIPLCAVIPQLKFYLNLDEKGGREIIKENMAAICSPFTKK